MSEPPPLWDDIDDHDLEAELQRQLDAIDGTGSEDDEDSEAAGAAQLLDEAATATENQDVKQEEEEPPEADSAWSQLMATMTADTNHWDEYEQDLVDLRTSMKYVKPRPAEKENNMEEGENKVPTSPQSPNTGNIFGMPVPNNEEEDDNDADAGHLRLQMKDPELYVQEIQNRLKTLLEEEEKEEKAEKTRAELRKDSLEHEEQRSSMSNTTGDVGAVSDRVDVAKERPDSSTPSSATFHERANYILRQSSNIDALVHEAKSNMTQEELEWQTTHEEHEKEVQQNIADQQQLRLQMEEELKQQREHLRKEQEERTKQIEQEQNKRRIEIEKRAQEQKEKRLEIERERERTRIKEEETMKQLMAELEEADREREREMKIAMQEKEKREHSFRVMKVRWNLEERSAKTIQRHFYAMRSTHATKRAMAAVALFVQSRQRGMLGRKRAHAQRRTRAIKTLAQWWHSRTERFRYLQTRAVVNVAVVSIQSLHRGRTHRRRVWKIKQQQQVKRHEAANRIIAIWRQFIQQREFLDTVAASTVMCSAVRGHLGRKFSKKKNAVSYKCNPWAVAF